MATSNYSKLVQTCEPNSLNPTSRVQNPRTKILFLFFESLSTCTKKKKKKKQISSLNTEKSLRRSNDRERCDCLERSLSLSLSLFARLCIESRANWHTAGKQIGLLSSWRASCVKDTSLDRATIRFGRVPTVNWRPPCLELLLIRGFHSSCACVTRSVVANIAIFI